MKFQHNIVQMLHLGRWMKLRRASNSRDGVIEGGDDAQQHNAQWHQAQRHSLLEEARQHGQ